VAGQPITVDVQVTGPSTTSGSLTPTGQVTVTDGTRSCLATLSGSNGTATGSCSITETTADDFSLTASYPGGTAFSSSSTASPTVVTVAKVNSKTALKLSAARVTYGDEQVDQLSVLLSPEFLGATPTGTVTVKEATITLCVIKLSSDEGSCKLSAKKLEAGIYDLVAMYEGSANIDPSASAKETLTVAKATSRTVLKLSAAKVTYGHDQVEHLSVAVSLQFSGSMPTGTVTIKESTTTLCVIKPKSGKGSCTLSPKKLAAGTYHLVATYGGSANFRGSTSAKENLTVAN
jgi:hypothetical protein